jgi:hypothetical protein
MPSALIKAEISPDPILAKLHSVLLLDFKSLITRHTPYTGQLATNLFPKATPHNQTARPTTSIVIATADTNQPTCREWVAQQAARLHSGYIYVVNVVPA